MDIGLRVLKGILCRLNYNANSIHILVGHLIFKSGPWLGRSWGPENWNGDIWADSDASEYLEPLNSTKPPLQVQVVLHPLSKENRLPLPEECVMASPEIAALQGTADVPADPPQNVSLSRHITSLKAQKVLGVRQKMWPVMICNTSQMDYQDLDNLCQQKGGKYIFQNPLPCVVLSWSWAKRKMCHRKAAAIVPCRSGSKAMRDRRGGPGSSGLSSLFSPPTPCPLSHSASSSSQLLALLINGKPRPTRNLTKNVEMWKLCRLTPMPVSPLWQCHARSWVVTAFMTDCMVVICGWAALYYRLHAFIFIGPLVNILEKQIILK